MRCPQCQGEASVDATICSKCGAELNVVCFRCKTSNALENKFCKECGQKLMVALAESPGFHQSPETYTPKYLVSKIRSAASRRDERKQVTVLFADIKGSLELIADRDPEDASRILDAVLQLMIAAVHRYEGTVNRVMGDGIMAIFGAPLALENHAARACYAALLMQETIKQFSDEARRTEGFYVQVRIGINSGEVIVRSIRSDLQMDYAAVGEATHLAARMEQIATPGSILITSEVTRLTEGYIKVKPLGLISVKGARVPVEAFELIGVGVTQSRLQAAAARGLTRFVGRTPELNTIVHAMRLVNEGHGQAIAIVGEAGVGKSRLIYELIRSNYARSWLVVECESISHGRAPAYFSVADLLRNYFKIAARDTAASIRENVAGKILTLDGSLEDAIPPLLYVLEALGADHPLHRLEPSQRRDKTAQALKRLLSVESRKQPVLLVFEDVHSYDSASIEVLKSLVESISDSPILFIASYRPERLDNWDSRAYVRKLQLDPLPPDSVNELLLALLGTDPSLFALKVLLGERTEGNPFFIEEMVKNFVETHVLGGERGKHYLAQPISTVQVPPLVQDVIAARIDRLPSREKSLIREASVIGNNVPFDVLRSVSEVSEVELQELLSNLQSLDFIYETQLFPNIQYTFKHALTHQVAYGGLLRETRREIHAKVLECLETLRAVRLNESVEQLAHHALQAEMWVKAVMYLRQSGGKALDRSANKEAVRLFGQALEALKHLPEERGTLEEAIDVRFDIRNALQPLGELSQMLAFLQEAERLAVRIDDQDRLGWVAAYTTEYFRMSGAPSFASVAGERALKIAQELGDVPLQIVTSLPMGLLYHATGEYLRAIAIFQSAIAALKDAPHNERFGLFGLPTVHCRSFLAWCFAEIGNFHEGLLIADEAIRFAKETNQPSSVMYAYLGRGVVHLRLGNLERAVLDFERALELVDAAQIPVGFSYGASYLGYALALLGRTSEALPLLEESVNAPKSKIFVARHSLRIAYLGEGYLLHGRTDDAMSVASQALESARKHEERGHEAYALRLFGEVMIRTDEALRAKEYFEDAMRISQELGMTPLVGHCHWGLARLFCRVQEPTAQERHAEASRAVFLQLGMAGWLRQLDLEFTVPGETSWGRG
jgi:class 3 adenylate cyclase/tetratricopeptide (TPR) repeat protein